jgi:hypothetical protein
MKKDRLGKLYSNFTGEERFRLHLEAVCRGDEAEVKRLLESCARETCSMNEADFANRGKASKEIVDILYVVLAPLLAKLEMVETFREALPHALKIYINEAVFAYRDGHQAGARRAWEAAGKMGDPPGWKERKGGDEEDKDLQTNREMVSLRNLTKRLEKTSGAVVGPLEKQERELVEEALTIWTAFAHCCSEECGVEPEKLVKVWFEPMLPQIERLKHLSASTELNPEMLEEYEAALKKRWSEVVGPG